MTSKAATRDNHDGKQPNGKIFIEAWIALIGELDAAAQGARASHEAADFEAALGDLKTKFIKVCALLPSTSVEIVALKMALWRRAVAETDLASLESEQEQLGYAVYRDLIDLTGRSDLLVESDGRSRLGSASLCGAPSR